jgi:hypothetical protein
MEATTLLSFKLLSQPDVILFTDNVIQKMTTNPLFTSLKSLIDPVIVSFDVFKTAFNLAHNGGYLLNADKDKKHKELLDLLVFLARGVDTVAKGDRLIIIASGFKPSAEPQSITELTIPTNFKVFNHEDNGTIIANWDKVDNKVSYALEMRVVGEDTWKGIAFPTARTVTLKGLARGLHLAFRVRAMGTKGIMSGWSVIKDVFVD